MSRNKAKDDQFFNCSQPHELDYVSGLYDQKEKVLKFLKEKCADQSIYHMTHAKLYALIKKELGFDLPH